MASDTDKTQTEQTEHQSEARPQAAFDASFFEQMSGNSSPSSTGWDVTTQVVQSYFEQADSQLRQARRMADLWAQSLILQQTTSEIARIVAPAVYKQVIEQLRNDPSLVKQLTNQ